MKFPLWRGHLKACCRAERSDLLSVAAVERTRSYRLKMQKGGLESFGKSFLLSSGSYKISDAGKNSERKHPGRCLQEESGLGAPALGTRVLCPLWEVHRH